MRAYHRQGAHVQWAPAPIVRPAIICFVPPAWLGRVSVHTPSVRSRTAYTKCQVPHCIHQVSGPALHTPSVRSRTAYTKCQVAHWRCNQITPCLGAPLPDSLCVPACLTDAGQGQRDNPLEHAPPYRLLLLRGHRHDRIRRCHRQGHAHAAHVDDGGAGAWCASRAAPGAQRRSLCSAAGSAAPGFASVQFPKVCSPRICLGAVPRGLQPQDFPRCSSARSAALGWLEPAPLSCTHVCACIEPWCFDPLLDAQVPAFASGPVGLC